jgi:DNA-binding Lrp family transcriptional regulator
MSHIRIKNDYFRTPEFIRFLKTAKSTVYFFLLSAVIRESTDVKKVFHGGHYIYRAHYLKGELVSRYSQEKMAKYLETSQPRISSYIAELEKEGLIKVIKLPTRKGVISYYQVGVWSGEIGKETYQETLWLDEIFTACYESYRKMRAERRREEAEQEMIEMFGGDREAYARYMEMYDF